MNIVQTTHSSNLVTSLIQHEQVKTTLPKARDAARLAEKVSSYPLSSAHHLTAHPEWPTRHTPTLRSSH